MSATANFLLNRFNYGLLSSSALARTDLARGTLGAEIQTNVIGKSLGAGKFRPGLGYLDSTKNNAKAIHIPFIYSLADTAILEITDSTLRVRISEAVMERVSVSTAITNGTFAANLTGWTSADEVGALSYHSDTYMVLRGTGDNAAKRYQQVTVAAGDLNKEHAVRIVANRGPIVVRIGSTLGGDEYVSETIIEADGYGPGTYSFAFTPTGDFYIELSNRSDYADSLVDSVSVEASGDFELPMPYAAADLSLIRWAQSGNVVYLACDGYAPKKIIRYGTRSYGISDYSPNDGPFRAINTSATTMTPSGLSGSITLTSSVPYFRESMEGALFKLTSQGQKIADNLSALGAASGHVKITGVSDARKFDVTVSGSWSGTIQIQRSIAEPGAWAGSGLTSITTNGTFTYDDGADNSIYYYRLYMFAYTSGTAEITITTGQGSITGIVRALDYSSSTQMVCSVLSPLGGTDATDLWHEGLWSDYRGYPTCNALHEGRLWWAGRDKILGSVSDAYESFDEELEGDSAPINVNIGSGPVDRINGLLSTTRLIIFGETAERTARSTSLDEPLTPTNFKLITDTDIGSSPIQAVRVDGSALFARNEKIFFMSAQSRIDGALAASDMTEVAGDVGSSGFAKLVVQRLPETRIHCLRTDGKVALFVFDEQEEVKSWQIIETDGIVEDIFVMPADTNAAEDKVYYCVNRTINGSTKRYLEKWALESESVGGSINKMADSFVQVTVSGATCSGLSHLEGEDVIVWAEGRDYSSGVGNSQTKYTVTSGAITLSDSLADGSPAIVGLPYSGQWKSVKLLFESRALQGHPLTQRKRVGALGIIAENTHNKAIRFGPDFTTMRSMPRMENSKAVSADEVWSVYDYGSSEFPGDYTHDPRICLEFTAPRPATVLGMVVTMSIHDRV